MLTLGRRNIIMQNALWCHEEHLPFGSSLVSFSAKLTARQCSRKASQTWNPESWKKIVVCIIADGRRVVHPRVLDVLTALGVYQDRGQMKSAVNGKNVTAHLFEYTTSFGLDPDLRFKYPDAGIVPTQVIFCLKEKNQKKINSHRWVFNAFGPLLQVRNQVFLPLIKLGRPSAQYLHPFRCRNSSWQ